MKKVSLAALFLASFLGYAEEPITPIPQSIAHNPAKAALGKKLFFETLLSKDNTISCASCHNLALGGTDQMRVSTGINGAQGKMNAPTVFNTVFNFTQFWNGRAKNLNEQASGPLHNPIEMGISASLIEKRLNSSLYYRDAFRSITKRNTITYHDVTDAIAEFEKTLITPNSKFDRYLRGEIKLSPKEAQGYADFKRLGCVGCHNGVNIGGNSFQEFGAVITLPRDRKTVDRYTLTKRERDKNVFKVPSLRNIALTAPYFHDGRSPTLENAINTMAYHNLGTKLSSKEVQSILSFLHTLNGQIPYQSSPK